MRHKESDSLLHIFQEVGFQKVLHTLVRLVQTCSPEFPLTQGPLAAKLQTWLRVSLIPPGADNKDTKAQRWTLL